MNEELKVRACLRSGYCCKKVPCGYGKWNAEQTQCEHLGGDEVGEHYCKIYEEISKDPNSYYSPAFGAGCCSALNGDRQELVRRRGNESFVIITSSLK